MNYPIPITMRNGLSREGLEEFLYHATAYIGFIAASGGSHIAASVIGNKQKRKGIL